ncbi:MAG: DNA/RNA nuclease SfsA [Pseudomonadota bacterium]
MKFPSPLIPATLIKRYKRFLADVRFDDGSEITCAVPNTGSMMGLHAPGSRVWLSTSDNPKRKYAHTLELVEADGTTVGINTNKPNRLTEEAIGAGLISDLASYPTLQREKRYGENSRIDILLSSPDRPDAYVEVKNVHFIRQRGLTEFPDSVTSRGAKHLYELARMVEAGNRAVMVYLVQRSDCERLKLCRELDPNYAKAFDHAMAAGVEAYAVRCHVTSTAITPECAIVVDEPGVNSNLN